ncbi:GntR family transcriptional regulator [Nocardioides sp. GXZ039]|uniref:GntR family transcriptional regulator n=1 Tax=Nocardioides sp. GXZ039 TaxID=3136018 RepID=UPI0030F40EA1
MTARTNTYHELKQAVLGGEFKPGEALREIQVAQRCGVSRTPVREALQRLEQDGLVCWDGPNLIVRRRSPEEILDIYSTRIVLEGAAAAFAADRRTDHDLRQLRWVLERSESVDVTSVPAIVEVNRLFNRRVWQAGHNESLIDLLERLTIHLGRYPETTLCSPGRWEQSLTAHRGLLTAIEERDAETARSIAQRHFTQAREIRLALFAAEDVES